MKLISYEDLKPEKGIKYSKDQLRRKEKAGEFPKRVPVGGQRYGWLENEIDQWIGQCAAARHAAGEAV